MKILSALLLAAFIATTSVAGICPFNKNLTNTTNRYAIGLITRVNGSYKLGIAPYLVSSHSSIWQAATMHWNDPNPEVLWGGELKMDPSSWAGTHLQGAGIVQINETSRFVHTQWGQHQISLPEVKELLIRVPQLLSTSAKIVPWSETEPHLNPLLNSFNLELAEAGEDVRHSINNIFFKLLILGFGSHQRLARLRGTTEELLLQHSQDPQFLNRILTFSLLLDEDKQIQINQEAIKRLRKSILLGELTDAIAEELVMVLRDIVQQWEYILRVHETMTDIIFIDLPTPLK